MTSLSLLKRKPYTPLDPNWLLSFLSPLFLQQTSLKNLVILSAPFTPSTNFSVHINQNPVPSLLQTILSKGTKNPYWPFLALLVLDLLLGFTLLIAPFPLQHFLFS